MKRNLVYLLALSVWAGSRLGWSQDVLPPPPTTVPNAAPQLVPAAPPAYAPPAAPTTSPAYAPFSSVPPTYPPPGAYPPPPPPDANVPSGSYPAPPPPPPAYQAPPPGAYPPPPPSAYPAPPPGAVIVPQAQPYPYVYPPPRAVVVGPRAMWWQAPPPIDSHNWTVSADALFLERNDGGVYLGGTSWNPASGYYPALRTFDLHSDDAWFPAQAGLRLEVEHKLNEFVSLSGTYWGLQQWSVGDGVYGDPTYQSVLATSPFLQLSNLLPGQGFDDNLSYAYQSQVDNVEFNANLHLVDYDYMHFDCLLGVRYVYLADQFSLTGVDDAHQATEQFSFGTSNNLIGPQIGLHYTQGWSRFQWDVGVKLGLMANMYHQQGMDAAYGPGVPAGFVPGSPTNDGAGFSALFEFSLGFRVAITENLGLRLGYQLYDITGLAVAPKQLGGFDHGANVLLDGLSIGLQATW